MRNEEIQLRDASTPHGKFFILHSSFFISIKKVKIIIAGAGAVGTHLAKLLSREKQDIILMDDNEDQVEHT